MLGEVENFFVRPVLEPYTSATAFIRLKDRSNHYLAMKLIDREKILKVEWCLQVYATINEKMTIEEHDQLFKPFIPFTNSTNIQNNIQNNNQNNNPNHNLHNYN